MVENNSKFETVSFFGHFLFPSIILLATNIGLIAGPPAARPNISGDKKPDNSTQSAQREKGEARMLAEPAVKTVVPVRLPSKSDPSGLEVNLLIPEKTRYKDGAPVVVRVEPTVRWSPAGRVDTSALTALGFVVIDFAYPAGDNFDNGGPNCRRAVADVMLFAMGRKSDRQDKTIKDICPVPLDGGLAGAIGLSHGGNSVVTTLEEYADELAGLAFYVSYESPCGTGKDKLGDSIVVDYGAVKNDPDIEADDDGDGFAWDDARNPFYKSDTGLDMSKLAWDPNAVQAMGKFPGSKGTLFIDANGNGKVDLIGESSGSAREEKNADARRDKPRNNGRATEEMHDKPQRGGELATDLNHNGSADPAEDYCLPFFLGSFGGKNKRVYSLPVITAAAKKIWSDSIPPDIATPRETLEYWTNRDMAANFESLKGKMPDLMVIIYSARCDHVQAQTDYPHIRAQYDGLIKAGVKWVKINPDPAYVKTMSSVGELKLPANKPNQQINAADFWKMTEPFSGPVSPMLVSVSAAELADRIKAGNRQDILTGVLYPDSPAFNLRVPKNIIADCIKK